MSAELQAPEDAARDLERDADLDFVDPRRLSAVIDRLQGALCTVVSRGRKRGDHLLAGQSACSWVANQCQMSKTTAADRLCVGDQLSNLPKIAEALSSGQIGYQATAVICHLSEQVGEKREDIDQNDWLGLRHRCSVQHPRQRTHQARARWDGGG